MASPRTAPKAAKHRRSQAQRSQWTRARAIEAALGCIVEEGFRKTDMASIAARAGVTPGAIQHQFGDKAGILFAVIEHGLTGLTTKIAGASRSEGPLTDRISSFVDSVWSAYSADVYRATLEVLVSMRTDESFHARALDFSNGIRRSIDRMWMGVFWDAPATRDGHIRGQRALFTTLSGLALEKILSGAEIDVGDDLEQLKETLSSILTGAASTRRQSSTPSDSSA